MKEHFIQCSQFLKKWNHFLKLEPIRLYPEYCPEELKPWIKILKQKSLEELVAFENNYDIRTDNHELTQLLSNIRALIEFPSTDQVSERSLISTKLKQKKQHEIKRILDLTDHIGPVTFIDIGGGAGHLSENLVYRKDRFSYCIDQNLQFQKSGKQRIQNNSIPNAEKVQFKNMTFGEQAQLFQSHHEKNMVLGLHACGDLTPEILNYSNRIQADHLLSIGCCYQKLTDKYNLSSLAREHGIQFTTNAFNLAARCHSYQSLERLEQKIKIRSFRYGLHLYLYFLGHKEFIPTGRTGTDDYERSFEQYALKYAGKYIKPGKDARKFYDSTEVQELISMIIHTDLLRGLFGRVIETYLVLDRALFLDENGYEVSIMELFDRKLSPRNLAINAKRELL
jgi:hypothetical protein